jgi:hypothetical protein
VCGRGRADAGDHGSAGILDDRYSGFRRLDGRIVERHRGPDRAQRRGLGRGCYADFHCPHPFDEYGPVNEEIVYLARGGN